MDLMEFGQPNTVGALPVTMGLRLRDRLPGPDDAQAAGLYRGRSKYRCRDAFSVAGTAWVMPYTPRAVDRDSEVLPALKCSPDFIRPDLRMHPCDQPAPVHAAAELSGPGTGLSRHGPDPFPGRSLTPCSPP